MHRLPTAILCALACSLLAPAAGHADGRIVTWAVPSTHIDFAKEPHIPPPAGVAVALHANVFLPEGYDGRRRFPVLYLFHGHGGRYDSWVDPHGEDLLHVAPHFPGIIVMPEAGNGWCTNWWHGGARAPAWERYHLEELIPAVEQRLRVLPGRSNHAIAGLSMGGGCAAYYAAARPGYFGAVAPFSGPLNIQRPEWPAGMTTQGESSTDVFGDPQAQEFYWEGHNPLALLPNLAATRMFVAVGDGTPTKPADVVDGDGFRVAAELELHQQALDFVAAAQAQHADVTTFYYPGVHQEEYWKEDLRRAIAWGLFKPVPEAPTSWTYRTVSSDGVAWGLSFGFVQPPDTVETFTRNGDHLRGDGSGTVRISGPSIRPFTAALPFDVVLQARPRAARRTRHVTKRHRRQSRRAQRARHASSHHLG